MGRQAKFIIIINIIYNISFYGKCFLFYLKGMKMLKFLGNTIRWSGFVDKIVNGFVFRKRRFLCCVLSEMREIIFH